MKFENIRVERIKAVVYYKPDMLSWKATDRNDHFIGIDITGSAKHNLGYKHIDLEPDYIYFFNQKDDFEAVTTEVGYCYSIHFTTYEPIETESFCKKVNNTDEIIKMIRKIEDLWHSRESGELSMLSCFYGLCDMFHHIVNAPYTPKDKRIMAAKEYLDLHFREKDCLSNAVKLSQITQRRFNDIFRLHFNSTPNSYIISKKIDYARELLLLNCLSIADASEMSGFSDVYYFSKMFKQKMGITPGEFKKINKVYMS